MVAAAGAVGLEVWGDVGGPGVGGGGADVTGVEGETVHAERFGGRVVGKVCKDMADGAGKGVVDLAVGLVGLRSAVGGPGACRGGDDWVFVFADGDCIEFLKFSSCWACGGDAV